MSVSGKIGIICARHLGDAVAISRLCMALMDVGYKTEVVCTPYNKEIFDILGVPRHVSKNIFWGSGERHNSAVRFIKLIFEIRDKKYDKVVFPIGDITERIVGYFISRSLINRYNLNLIEARASRVKKILAHVLGCNRYPSRFYEGLMSILSRFPGTKANELPVLFNGSADGHKGYALIAPEASSELKSLSKKAMTDVVEGCLKGNTDLVLVLYKGELEDFGETVKCKMEVFKGSLSDIFRKVALSDMVICADSLVQHLAGLYGKRCLSFTGANDPYYWLCRESAPIFSSGDCRFFPCINTAKESCGYKCKDIPRDRIAEVLA